MSEPRTEAGRALLAEEHERKGRCYASPACEHGAVIAGIETEARIGERLRCLNLLAEARERVRTDDPYSGFVGVLDEVGAAIRWGERP